MASLQDLVSGGVSRIGKRFGSPVIIWNGADYACIPAARTRNRNLETGGYEVEDFLTVVVRKSLFTDGVYPQSMQRITFEDEDYKIDLVKNDGTGAFLKLTCINVNFGI